MASSADRLPAGHVFPDDESVMQYALRIARQGLGRVEPNPPVGAVIVDDRRRLVADGWHEEFGAAHAEVNAIRAAQSTAGLRLFVTLEPCHHHGKTPPCSEAVAIAGFREVVVGCDDPAPHTSGQGTAALRAAGLRVTVGLCETDAKHLIAPFRMLQLHHRPWIHAKWAMTLDGKIASRTGHSQWITGEESRAEVHRLRGRMDGIITGAGTVRSDNPLLTARPPGPRTPIRVVVDADGSSIQENSQLAATIDLAPVIACIGTDQPDKTSARLSSLGIEVLRLPQSATGRVCLSSLVEELGRRQMTNVLIEAGAGLLGSFFDAELIDEVHAFVAPKIVGGDAAVSPIGGTGLEMIPQLPSLRDVSVRQLGTDLLMTGRLAR